MHTRQNRRKRKRTPTLTPRFGSNSVALEIALIRQSLETEREFLQNLTEEQPKNSSVVFFPTS